MNRLSFIAETEKQQKFYLYILRRKIVSTFYYFFSHDPDAFIWISFVVFLHLRKIKDERMVVVRRLQCFTILLILKGMEGLLYSKVLSPSKCFPPSSTGFLLHKIIKIHINYSIASQRYINKQHLLQVIVLSLRELKTNCITISELVCAHKHTQRIVFFSSDCIMYHCSFYHLAGNFSLIWSFS